MAALLVSAPPGEAQQAKRLPQVGLLVYGSPRPAAFPEGAIVAGLTELGWVEGQNMALLVRYAEGRPERLPDLPKAPREGGDLEAQALAQRLDVQGAKRDMEALARSLGLTKVTRYVSLLEFGVLSNSETGRPRQRGWEVELRLPIFDLGGARTARAERLYLQSMNRATAAAVQARSEVREAYGAYRTSFDLARHYRDEVVPLRKRISEEMLLRYNGMLASVFELLADSREQVAAVNAYIESLRDFWIAESDLQMALTGRSPGGMQPMRAASRAPASGGGGH